MADKNHVAREYILRSENVDILFQHGTANYAVISFAGIGLGLGGLQTTEFSRSLGNTTPTFYVIDKTRSWYNSTYDVIVEALAAALETRKLAYAATVGNSMGGFGAMLFAEALSGMTISLAFAPQSSVCRTLVPWETRWQNWTGRITAWTIPDLAPRLGRVQHHVVFGSNDPLDRRHAARLAASRNVKLHEVSDCGHDVAAVLKQRGQLAGFLSMLAPAN
jgi:pimeloyl-ACP methyl ester carboxylesterase